MQTTDRPTACLIDGPTALSIFGRASTDDIKFNRIQERQRIRVYQVGNAKVAHMQNSQGKHWNVFRKIWMLCNIKLKWSCSAISCLSYIHNVLIFVWWRVASSTKCWCKWCLQYGFANLHSVRLDNTYHMKIKNNIELKHFCHYVSLL